MDGIIGVMHEGGSYDADALTVRHQRWFVVLLWIITLALVGFMGMGLLHVVGQIVSHLNTPKRIAMALDADPDPTEAKEAAPAALHRAPSPPRPGRSKGDEDDAQSPEQVWENQQGVHTAVARLLQNADPDQAIVLVKRSIAGEEQAVDLAHALYPQHRKTFTDLVAEERENVRQYWGKLSPADRQELLGHDTGKGADALEKALRQTQDTFSSPDYLRLMPEELLHCFITNIDSEIDSLADGSCSLYQLLRGEILPVTSLTARIWAIDTPYEVQFDGGYADAQDHLNDSFSNTVLIPALQRFFKNMERRYERAPPETQEWFRDVLGRRFCRFLGRIPNPLEEGDMRRAWRTAPEQVRALWSRQLLAEFDVDETCPLPLWLRASNYWFRLASSPVTEEHYRMIRKHPAWRGPLRGLQYATAARALTAICHHLGAGCLARELRPLLLKPLQKEREIMIGTLIDWGQLRGLLDVEQPIPKALQPSLGSSTGKRYLKPRWHVGHYRTWAKVPTTEFRDALRRLADTEGDAKRRLHFYELEGLYAQNRALD